ncbi:hypothetical protein [Horticoccus sp. 23ND18S-11]|uniref:hypothetical protein n=1 Tax=Horticoccus sp. 23ND18S-11 TaxID=3391832 RepID=UPI0039C9B4AA
MSARSIATAPAASLAGPAEIQNFLRRRARWARWFFVIVAITATVIALVAGKGEPAALATAGVVVVAMALLTLAAKRRLDATWIGEVVRKEVREIRHRKSDDDIGRRIEHLYLIHVRTDTGARREVSVGQSALERYYTTGERVVKIGGLPMPLKLTSAHPGLCASCGEFLPTDASTCNRCTCPVPDPTRFH